MTAKSFLDNFSRVVNAPEGVKYLRQLIMDSALSGKFSKPNDELSSNLEKLLQEARSTYLHSAGKREKPLVFGQPLIREFEIPVGWKWVRVGQICDLQTGATPSTRKPEYWGGRIPWLASGDINKQEIFECKGRITEEGLANSNCKVLPNNSVLMALNGQGKTRATVALLRIAAACNQSLVAMIPYDDGIVLPDFLFLSLRYRYHEIRDITGHDQRRGLNMGLVSELSVPLAPLIEQKRIVVKVDELMRLCDRLEAQQQEREKLLPLLSRANHTRFVTEPTDAHLRALFHAPGVVSPDDLQSTICSLAVSGHLVSRRSEEDVADALFKHNIAPLTLSDAPKLPEHWKWVRLGDAATTMNSGWSPACPPKPANPDQWGVLKTTAVQALEYLENENKVLPSSMEPRPEAEVHDGDILLTRAGPKNRVGIICVARPTRPHLMISDKIIRLHLITDIVPDFGALVLNTGYTSTCIENLKSGMAASQMNISQPKLRSVPIPIPPKGEQLRILDRVSQLLILVRKLAEQKLKQRLTSESFAKAAVAAITSTEFTENERMKPPKTEVVTALKVGKKPKKPDAAPLAILLWEHKAEASAKTLWQLSGLEIDAFYRQLKTEMANGWIEEDEDKRAIKEIEAR